VVGAQEGAIGVGQAVSGRQLRLTAVSIVAGLPVGTVIGLLATALDAVTVAAVTVPLTVPVLFTRRRSTAMGLRVAGVAANAVVRSDATAVETGAAVAVLLIGAVGVLLAA